jgi:hypothetical protein
MPRGQRPSRLSVDGQRKGTEAIDPVYHEKQVAFLRQMRLEDMLPPPPAGAERQTLSSSHC